MSEGFGLMQLLDHHGRPNGFIESFIHSDRDGQHYGARYYDEHGALQKEDFFLSRAVGRFKFPGVIDMRTH